ncbi:HoxN/HupN/NixA family nickel/cobalt transporter [Falsiruegeria mediterranea]|uniref:Nickel/cobalt efflux system n=1 Tax=Falsiruegeria mediterranea M17 TaxID=1200281 RepID=A0A2R8CA25_9RHOB|nr:DUF3299 domain-containing protein [Falsiruegeria mediterranea]SPJ29196.1 hypothetical protein TRM7615_02709 [Falsiruegeria mediterranea M17]
MPALLVVTLLFPVASRSAPDLVQWDALASTRTTEGAQQSTAISVPPAHGLDPDKLDEFTALGLDVSVLQSSSIASHLLDQALVLDGYVLPLTWEADRVVEFLLVPWVGACIHTPAPPPNQIIHVSYPDGLSLAKQYDPVRLTGVLKHKPDYHPLFLVDGSRAIPTVYEMENAALFGKPGDIVAASASNIPAMARAQIWVNGLFTQSMSALGGGGSIWAMGFALLLSFGYGALHTLGPGHGKTVVISYFVGTGGSLNRGLKMGVQISVIHVLSAVVVVFVLDFTVRYATGSAPSDYRGIRLGSYALIIAIGAIMVWQAVRAILARRSVPHEHDHHDHHHHSHDHDHHHDHGHDHDHAHHHGHAHHTHDAHSGCAACASAAAAESSGGWLAASVGVVPCTGALLVMLFGLANDLIWPAILMVVFISIGMAVAMSAIGVAALWGRQWAASKFDAGSKGLERFELGIRFAGAMCVLAIGLVLFSVTWSLSPMPDVPVTNIAQPSTESTG